MDQQRQHAVIIMELQLRFKKHYFYKTPPETGTEIHYNIKHAKKQPELLNQYIQGKQIHLKYNQTQSTTDNWQTIKTMLREALITVYPIIRKDNTIQIWERAGYENSTPEENNATWT